MTVKWNSDVEERLDTVIDRNIRNMLKSLVIVIPHGTEYAENRSFTPGRSSHYASEWGFVEIILADIDSDYDEIKIFDRDAVQINEDTGYAEMDNKKRKRRR
jgi:hypothetical protein